MTTVDSGDRFAGTAKLPQRLQTAVRQRCATAKRGMFS
jgi:hypothetical protein